MTYWYSTPKQRSTWGSISSKAKTIADIGEQLLKTKSLRTLGSVSEGSVGFSAAFLVFPGSNHGSQANWSQEAKAPVQDCLLSYYSRCVEICARWSPEACDVDTPCLHGLWWQNILPNGV